MALSAVNNVRLSYLALVASLLMLLIRPSLASFDYHDALEKSLLFFEAQRSGTLPPDQRVVWRGDSALNDGKSEGVDLEGGYYDAGDHVKYGFPMAYSITMLSWGVLQWTHALTLNGQLGYALEAIKWGTDYFIKAHTQPNVLWAEVGDGTTDHDCWQRAEDMTTSRQAYLLDAAYPGSDQVGETAAAMAAASITFQNTDLAYSQTLLKHARELFTFADTYRGNYDNSITNTKAYYKSVSGYNDELLWAAIWLYEATGEQPYLDYVIKNANILGGTGWAMKEMSWDVKYAGVQILASKILLEGKGYVQNTAVLKQYQTGAEFYLCSLLRKNTGSNNAQFTPGGLLFTRPWNNMQYVTSASFILGVYSDYLSAAGQQLQCPSGSVPPSELLSLAQSQVNYILGDNPMGMSYMVGYGARYPQHVHHRGASIISYKKSPGFVSCKGGYEVWYASNDANPNVLVGALVGGPDAGDHYADDRSRYEQSEPTTSTNGPLVGILARFAGGQQPQSYGPVKDNHRPPPHLAPYTPKSSPSPSPPTGSYPTLPSPRPLPHPKTPSRGPPHTYTPGKAPPTPRPVTFRQVVTLSWTHEKKIYRRYEVRVTNISRGRLLNIKFLIKDLTGPLWGLSKVPRTTNLYSFPPSIQSLTPHKTVKFIYIQPGPPATISLSSFGSPTY